MNHSIPLRALAGFFIIVGVALFLLAFKSPAPAVTSAPPKKAELRVQAEQRKESGKLRLAGLLFFVFGTVMFFLV